MISFNNFGGFARLGNQLFQLATIMSLSKNNDDDFIVSNFKYSKYYDFDIKIGYSNFTNKYKETSSIYNKIIYTPNIDLDGYFQSEKYFIDNEKYIRDNKYINKKMTSNLMSFFNISSCFIILYLKN